MRQNICKRIRDIEQMTRRGQDRRDLDRREQVVAYRKYLLTQTDQCYRGLARGQSSNIPGGGDR